MPLPIESVLPDLSQALADQNQTILRAPPGAGKSTCVPLALLNHPTLESGKIILLEPRRLAARAVAQRLAEQLGEKVGATVGYRMRQDTKVSAATRIEVVTEGILTRLIQDDPELSGVSCVIFDEFHERSLQADLGLALCLDVQAGLRDDLRILVMSATLDTESLGAVLDEPAVVTSEGRSFPVEVAYLDRRPEALRPVDIARHIVSAVSENSGSVLVFLPGVGEIRRVESELKSRLDDGVVVAPLYGGLSLEDQRLAIAPAPEGQRKVVLSTAIAETSLTIEGIEVVVDLGLERCSVFSPRLGMDSLITRTGSRASAEQRAGRAGRLGPGRAYRLWTESEQVSRRAFSTAEIQEADLAPLVLELARWGIADPGDLRWVDLPPEPHVAQAKDLLRWLGALDERGRLTSHGEAMAALPVHPRLAHMLVLAGQQGSGRLAAEVAALLEEPAPMSLRKEADFAVRLRYFQSGEWSPPERGWGQRVKQQAKRYASLLKGSGESALDVAELLALAFPDRIGQRRGQADSNYRLSGGGSASFSDQSAVSMSEFVVVAELDGRARESRVYTAVSIDQSQLAVLFAEQLEQREVVDWDRKTEAMLAERQTRLGELVLDRKAIKNPDPEQVKQGLMDQVRRRGLELFEDADKAQEWRARVRLLRDLEGEDSAFPDVSDEALLGNVGAWLSPWLDGVTRLSQLKKVSLCAALQAMLEWPLQQRLDQEAPTHFLLPTGNRARLDYSQGEVPVLAARMQELFSTTETPSIARGRIKLQVHLLSPARRPLQITQDLVSFWQNGYAEVKKEMKGRYPKHHWPDDPMHTAPHSSVRPRS